MKNMLLCTMIILSIVGDSYSQQHSISQNLLQLKVYEKGGLLISEDTYEDELPASLDLEGLINKVPAGERVMLHGYYTKEELRHSVFYSAVKTEGQLCKNETLQFKPMLGISGYSNKNFSGLVIKEVREDSPAAKLGLVTGDIVYSIASQEVSTYCDLNMAVRKTKVGEVVTIEYNKNGRIVTEPVTAIVTGSVTILPFLLYSIVTTSPTLVFLTAILRSQ